MSTVIMSKCWPIGGMTPSQKAVLISLSDNANDDGVCWPSISTIAKRTCLTERGVQLAIKWLVQSKILSKAERYGRSTVFTITPELYSPRTVFTPELSSPPPPNSVHPTPELSSPRTVIEPSIEPSDMSPPAAATPDRAHKADPVPYERIRELYNKILGTKLSRCMPLDDKRRKHIKACYNLVIDGCCPAQDQGLEFWEGLFNDVLDCPFLLGVNDKGWRADFEFLTTATKVQRFFEGKYDAR